MIKTILILLLLSAHLSCVQAEEVNENGPPDQTELLDSILGNLDDEAAERNADSELTLGEFRELQENHRFIMVLGLIISTPVVLLMLLFFMSKAKNCEDYSILNVSGLVLVIEGTVIVVISSPTTEQLTAAIGVLAAIAGYLFGSNNPKNTETKINNDP